VLTVCEGYRRFNTTDFLEVGRVYWRYGQRHASQFDPANYTTWHLQGDGRIVFVRNAGRCANGAAFR